MKWYKDDIRSALETENQPRNATDITSFYDRVLDMRRINERTVRQSVDIESVDD